MKFFEKFFATRKQCLAIFVCSIIIPLVIIEYISIQEIINWVRPFPQKSSWLLLPFGIGAYILGTFLWVSMIGLIKMSIKKQPLKIVQVSIEGYDGGVLLLIRSIPLFVFLICPMILFLYGFNPIGVGFAIVGYTGMFFPISILIEFDRF